MYREMMKFELGRIMRYFLLENVEKIAIKRSKWSWVTFFFVLMNTMDKHTFVLNLP